ncbi:MAG: response regulator [Alphaproteobacteria bacterium]|nr:MAG: response regulator [Alphaproteobacteria bacterium]TMJ40937.1 MAG: response regulator [Alphaproteobacteria bacterium]
MPITQKISPHIPYLRRYARALTGSQKSGDAYVAAVIESLVADPSSFDSELKPKVALYKVFTKIWRSLRINRQRSEGAVFDHDIDSKLDIITPPARQAFLLLSIEDFTNEEAAAILDVSEKELDSLMAQAGSEIAEQIATNVLIIEDEPIIAMDVEHIVRSLGHDVAGIARTHNEAVALARRGGIGLVLADIQLADGSSGINAVNEILQNIELPVIFITAYPERLLTGERPEPTFLITKPFQPETVKAVISQALFFESAAHTATRKSA